MKKFFAVLALMVASLTTPLAAATLTLASGTIDLQVVQNNSDFSIAAFDLRNVAGFQLLEGSINSIVVIGDGTNLGAPSPASPNTQLLVSNLSASQGFLLAFSNVRGDGGSGLLVDANFSISLGAVTDPELLYLSGNPLTFSFAANNIAAGGGNVDPLGQDQIISYWSVTAGVGPTVETVVPEPGSMVLIGGGVALIAFARRRRS